MTTQQPPQLQRWHLLNPYTQKHNDRWDFSAENTADASATHSKATDKCSTNLNNYQIICVTKKLKEQKLNYFQSLLRDEAIEFWQTLGITTETTLKRRSRCIPKKKCKRPRNYRNLNSIRCETTRRPSQIYSPVSNDPPNKHSATEPAKSQRPSYSPSYQFNYQTTSL